MFSFLVALIHYQRDLYILFFLYKKKKHDRHTLDSQIGFLEWETRSATKFYTFTQHWYTGCRVALRFETIHEKTRAGWRRNGLKSWNRIQWCDAVESIVNTGVNYTVIKGNYSAVEQRRISSPNSNHHWASTPLSILFLVTSVYLLFVYHVFLSCSSSIPLFPCSSFSLPSPFLLSFSGSSVEILHKEAVKGYCRFVFCFEYGPVHEGREWGKKPFIFALSVPLHCSVGMHEAVVIKTTPPRLDGKVCVSYVSV